MFPARPHRFIEEEIRSGRILRIFASADRTAAAIADVAAPMPKVVAIAAMPVHDGPACVQAVATCGIDALARALGGIREIGERGFSAIVPRRKARPSGSCAGQTRSVKHPAQHSHDQRTDEALFVAHRAGDPQALRVLIERYRAELHGFLVRLVGSQSGADDVFQEAFLQVHLSAESFDEERRFKPWLYTIAANKGRDYLRRQKRRAAVSIDAPATRNGDGALVDLLEGGADAPSDALERDDEREAVKKVIDELPSHFREILLLGYFQKLSYAQIADSLAIPLGTVKSRLHAAVASFAESWKLACERRSGGRETKARTSRSNEAP